MATPARPVRVPRRRQFPGARGSRTVGRIGVPRLEPLIR
jgi:hypothetical protein